MCPEIIIFGHLENRTRLNRNKSLLTSLLILSLSLLSSAQTCIDYTFPNNKVFATCTALPVLSSFLHWTYHQANSTVDIAYRHTNVNTNTWVAWALNLLDTRASGAQSLVAYHNSSGLPHAYTSALNNGNATTLAESTLSFGVPSISAEYVNNAMVIYATLALPSGQSVFNQVWQSGPVSGGSPQVHALTGDNLKSFGSVDFVTGVINLPRKKSRNRTIIVGSSLGALFGACLLVGSCIFVSKMKREQKELDDEFSVDKVPGMPTRFSYNDLKIATNDFNNQLGKGGFGSVFQGTLRDGTQVAVKRLNGSSQIKKSFLAEVQTIGNIHHVNLVRLIGFCAENSNRLLVYEYMSNGSLDRWIFERHQELTLGWESRRKIIADIAKGLAYLHEECRQKIYHLDVKPQNILLDEKFEAKVSDFGLAKLIDKDQSKVLATLGGTPGYMAPEWLSSIITEKVDVYSFGVVVLEILCGRKNLDRSQSEEEMHLLGLLERKGEEGQLLDMVNKSNADMQLHRAEVVEMMKLAVWCLQSDYRRRPSMTVVVQVLEGLVSVQDNLDYNFINAPTRRTIFTAGEDMDAKIHGGTTLSASVLSGPR